MKWFVILLLLVPSSLVAKVRVFACEPEWAALAQTVAADAVEVYSATTAQQDPHRIQARPSLIAKARKADLLFCSGADLEIGWLPLLLRKANNPKIQPGQPGHLLAAEHVPLLDVHTEVDRSMGDVHAAGNPHVHLDPHNIAILADVLAARLQKIDPSRAPWYELQRSAFADQWRAALQRWEQQAKPLRGTPIVVYHRSWTYLEHWLRLVQIASIESKPGIPPSSKHLHGLSTLLKDKPAAMIVHAHHTDPRAPQWLAERTMIPIVVLPFTVGATDQVPDLFALYDALIQQLLNVSVTSREE